MRSTINTMSRAFLLTLVVMLVQGCASDHPATPKMMAPKRMIMDITTIEKADRFTVVVQGDQPLTYTFMQPESSRALVLKFADTGFDPMAAVYFPPENFAVHSIQSEVSKDGMEARVVLRLKELIPYQLVPEENSLKVVFINAAASAQIASPLPGLQAARQQPPSTVTQTAPVSGILKEVSVACHGAGVAVYLRVDGHVGDHKTFTIDDPLPARIVVDLVGLRSAFRGEEKIPIEGKIVKQVRHFGHPDKVRVVVETGKAYLKNFSVEPVETGVVLKIGAPAKNEN